MEYRLVQYPILGWIGGIPDSNSVIECFYHNGFPLGILLCVFACHAQSFSWDTEMGCVCLLWIDLFHFACLCVFCHAGEYFFLVI